MSSADLWSPDQYAQFREQRRQPWVDLVDLIERRPNMRVADLGCGPGQLTVELHETLSARETVGVDSSANMLERAPQHPDVSFVHDRIETFESTEPFDLVFSNAAVHWLEDHPAVLSRLTELLAPGGQLAIQVPANHAHPANRVADEIAALPQFAGPLGGYQRGVAVLPPAQYAELFYELGYQRHSVRLQVYGHELPGRDAVVEWVKGALLTAYERRMDAAEYERFVDAYRERLFAVLPDTRPLFFSFDRILMWGTHPPLP